MMPTTPMDYEAQEDARTLKRAAEIRRDPKRLRKIEVHLESELKNIGNVIEENALDVNTKSVVDLKRGFGSL